MGNIGPTGTVTPSELSDLTRKLLVDNLEYDGSQPIILLGDHTTTDIIGSLDENIRGINPNPHLGIYLFRESERPCTALPAKVHDLLNDAENARTVKNPIIFCAWMVYPDQIEGNNVITEQSFKKELFSGRGIKVGNVASLPDITPELLRAAFNPNRFFMKSLHFFCVGQHKHKGTIHM